MENSEFRKMLIKRSYNLAKNVISLVNDFPKNIAARIIADQLLRAATSIGANIVEAQAASSKKDFINFLNHGLKSGNETKFWLALSGELDKKLIGKIKNLLDETNEICRILGSSIAKLRTK